jgi:hypothetical protein
MCGRFTGVGYSYKTGSAWNADVRWEWVKGPHRLIAVGFFYKALQALPEVYLEPTSYTKSLYSRHGTALMGKWAA